MTMTRRQFVARGSAVAALGLRGLGQVGPAGLSIRAAGAGRGLLAGCAVNVHALRKDAAYKKLLEEQVGIVVGESEFKFGPLRPSPTTFFFEDADLLAAFAAANGMKLRGHNLCGIGNCRGGLRAM